MTDASANVTCTVTDENGTVILNGVTATSDGTGKYFVDLGISNTTDVNKLYAEWMNLGICISEIENKSRDLGFPYIHRSSSKSF